MFIKDVPMSDNLSEVINVGLMVYIGEKTPNVHMIGTRNTSFAVPYDPALIKAGLMKLAIDGEFVEDIEPLDGTLTTLLNSILKEVSIESFKEDWKELVERSKTSPGISDSLKKFQKQVKLDVTTLDVGSISTVEYPLKSKDIGMFYYTNALGLIYTKSMSTWKEAMDLIPGNIYDIDDSSVKSMRDLLRLTKELNDLQERYIITVKANNMVKTITLVTNNTLLRIY